MSGSRIAALGIVLGLLGAALLTVFVVNAKSQNGSEATARVLTAATGLRPGSDSGELQGAVELRELPQSVVPELAIASLADVDGQEVVRAVGPGEILTRSMFAPPGPVSGGLVVPQGWEAITVEIAPAPGLEGFATPGSLVNVYATIQPEVIDPATGQVLAAESVPFTQLVMAHTEVLAVTRGTLTGEATDPEEAGGIQGVVVLMLKVRPEDVPAFVHAQHAGQLYFTLANADDPSPLPVRVELDVLLPEARQHAIEAARAQLEADRAAAAPTAPSDQTAAQASPEAAAQ